MTPTPVGTRWPEKARETARDAWAVVQAADLGLLAAAVAYYAFVSVVPLLALSIAVGTAVGGAAFADALVGALSSVIAPGSADALADALAGGTGRVEFSLVGLAVLAWGASKVFRALDAGFSRVHGTADSEGFLERTVDALVALAVTGLGTVATVLAGAAVAGLTGVDFAGLLAPGALFVALVAVFLPLYWWFPDVEMAPREALPGAAVAAAGWTLLVTGYGLYAGIAPDYSLYGALGAALLLVTWFYLAAWVLLVGAAVNAVLRRDGAVQGDG